MSWGSFLENGVGGSTRDRNTNIVNFYELCHCEIKNRDIFIDTNSFFHIADVHHLPFEEIVVFIVIFESDFQIIDISERNKMLYRRGRVS